MNQTSFKTNRLEFSLNRQHDFLLEVYENNLIHPSIPKGNFQSVADIATGTGYVSLDADKLDNSRK